MSKHFDRDAHFEAYSQVFKDVCDAECTDDPLIDFLHNEVGTSPLGGGRLAQKGLGLTSHIVQGRAIQNRLVPPAAQWPNVDPANAICLGGNLRTQTLVLLPRDLLTRHLLVLGPSGAGKTTFLRWLIDQLTRDEISIVFVDLKNEGRRLLNRYNDVVVLGVDRVRENFLAPIGDHATYYSGLCGEFARAYALRPETWPKLVPLLLRIAAGMEPGDPFLSLKDFEVLAARRYRQRQEGWLRTVALSLGSLNSILGQTARVRHGPNAEDLYPIVVYEYLGLPTRAIQFNSAARLHRFQLGVTKNGHAQELQRALIYDEAGLTFGRELSSGSSSGYISPQKRMISQIRSSGSAVLAGCQSLQDLDQSVKSNIGTFVCLGTRTPADAREAAHLLNLPAEFVQELQSLPVSVGYVKSELSPHPVKFQFPDFRGGDYISDEQVAVRMQPHFARLDQLTVYSDVPDDLGEPISYREVLRECDTQVPPPEPPPMPPPPTPEPQMEVPTADPDVMVEWGEFLREVLKNPEFGVRAHFESLDWSASKGGRVRDALIANGLLKSENVRSGVGRPTAVLSVTNTGRKLLEILDEH